MGESPGAQRRDEGFCVRWVGGEVVGGGDESRGWQPRQREGPEQRHMEAWVLSAGEEWQEMRLLIG